MLVDLSLYRAIPEERGCGDREAGGLYVESGVGPWGVPFEAFLLDPPRPLPPGLDLVNKPRIMPREWLTGNLEVDTFGRTIYDLCIHIGATFYPWGPDFLQEARRLGVSRRLPATLDLKLLNRASRMWLAHAKAIPLNWQELSPPDRCKKVLERHALAWYTAHQVDYRRDLDRIGPCIFKLWDLIPSDQAETITGQPGERPLCMRRIGSTLYPYRPTEESVSGWAEAFLLAIPLTGFSLIQDADGNVNEQAKEKCQKASLVQGPMHLPVYETPR
ncbi:MAG TPA: hypothetical protein VFV38_01715 [Ktedonobacteraceae bacterium]|nr:hypothetical protein [Ktedonobacteraceae bacterium]